MTIPARLEPSCPAPPANVDALAAGPVALAPIVVPAGPVEKVLEATMTVEVPGML